MSSTLAEKKREEAKLGKYAGMVPKLNEPGLRPEEKKQLEGMVKRLVDSANEEKLRNMLGKEGYSKKLIEALVKMNKSLNQKPSEKGERVSEQDLKMLETKMNRIIDSAKKEREFREQLKKDGYSPELIENLMEMKKRYEK